MLNMKQFHKVLSNSPKSNEPYLQALRAFTGLGLARLIAMTDGLGWEPW